MNPPPRRLVWLSYCLCGDRTDATYGRLVDGFRCLDAAREMAGGTRWMALLDPEPGRLDRRPMWQWDNRS